MISLWHCPPSVFCTTSESLRLIKLLDVRNIYEGSTAKLFQPFNYNAVKLKGFDMIAIDKWMTTSDMDRGPPRMKPLLGADNDSPIQSINNIQFHKSLGRSKTAMIYGHNSGGYCYGKWFTGGGRNYGDYFLVTSQVGCKSGCGAEQMNVKCFYEWVFALQGCHNRVTKTWTDVFN